MKRIDLRRVALGLAAPLLAIVVAFVVTSLILLIAGDPVGAVWAQLIDVPLPRQVVAIINAATVYYLRVMVDRIDPYPTDFDGQDARKTLDHDSAVPVVNRFDVYDLVTSGDTLSYMAAVKAHPAWRKWEEAARAEPWIVPHDEV